MPTKKSMSRSTDPGRRGLTLLEVLVAAGIGIVLLTLAVRAYLGANKAQNIAIAAGMIKSQGQSALHDLYYKLHQSHTIFDRGTTANSWLTKVPVEGHYTASDKLTPGYLTSEAVLPVITRSAAFSTTDAAFSAGNVGNALFFTTAEPEAVMGENGTGTELEGAFGTDEVHLTPFRLQLIVLVRRDLPLNAPAVQPGSRFTYQLMTWTSAPYLDYTDMRRWIQTLTSKGVSNAYVDGKLAGLTGGGFAGIVDVASTTSTNAIRKLVPTGDYLDFELETAPFRTFQYRAASKTTMKTGIGELFVAFNTSGTGAVPVGTLDVPAFASDGAVPYGFETMVGGPVGTRQALVRLSYAARTTPGNVMSGQTFQQVVQIFAEVPAQAATAAPTDTPATPTPAPTATGT